MRKLLKILISCFLIITVTVPFLTVSACRDRDWEKETTESSIDLDAQFYDFRSDGMLFEFSWELDDCAYGFVLNIDETETGRWTDILGRFPLGENTLEQHDLYVQRSGKTVDYVRTGLCEKELVNGHPVYTERAVVFLSWLINHGTYQKKVTGNAELLSSGAVPKNLNSGLRLMVDGMKDTYKGDGENAEVYSAAYNSAIAKTDTGLAGGVLLWEQIENPVDLAYYLLNSLFSADPETAAVPDTTFNVTVPEYDTLRLSEVRDESGAGTGVYTFDTYEYLPIYDAESGVISQSETRRTEKDGVAYFNPLDGLGFESETMYGDTTDPYVCHNWNYSMSAGGSFVFGRGENLYFSFAGDDDVYLYINGRLALDIGGAHSAIQKTVRLNDIAEDLGLSDGDVCRLDFFYAERHGSGSNFRIETNIGVQSREAVTEKNAYDGDGRIIPSGASVSSGTAVTYEFILKNTGNTPVYDLHFTDSTLGVMLSPDSVQLYDGQRSLRRITPEDLTLTYYTIEDDGALSQTTSFSPSGKDELEKLMSDGIAAGCAVSVKGFCKTLTASDAPYKNTVRTVCRSGSGDCAVYLRGCASRTVYAVSSCSGPTFVIDFSKPVSYGFDRIFTKSEMSRINEAVRRGRSISVSVASETGYYGTMTADAAAQSVTYTPQRFVNGADLFELNISFYSGRNPVCMSKKITIIPATGVYYEDTFEGDAPNDNIVYDGEWTLSENGIQTVQQDSDYDMSFSKAAADNYGFDSGYSSDSGFSNGTAHKSVTTNEKLSGKKDSVTFAFKGTGFEIYAGCGGETGVVHVYLYDGDGTLVRLFSADTLFSDGGICQIPVVSAEGLEYGSYTARIVNYASGVTVTRSNGGFTQKLSETSRTLFELDGIRILNPVGADGSGAGMYSAAVSREYGADLEDRCAAAEFRDIIFTAVGTGGYKGAYLENGEIIKSVFNEVRENPASTAEFGSALFTDVNSEESGISNLVTFGPKNEVYLIPGQSVTFTLRGGFEGKVMAGIKAPGGSGKYCISVNGEADGETAIASAADMFYRINACAGDTVTISCTDGLVSLTKLRVTGIYAGGCHIVTVDQSTARAALADTQVIDDTLEKGDANADGSINSKDANLLLKYMNGYVTKISTAADMNDDASINSKDTNLLMQKLCNS